jgi:hypothetical protein
MPIQDFELHQARRSIGMCIVLSIVTCGIYAVYWLYQLLRIQYRLTGQQSQAGLDIVLGIITCGIYYIYLAWKMGKMESEAARQHGMPPRDDSVMYVILHIFALAIINYAIWQANLNQLIDVKFGGGGSGPSPDYDSGTGRANY